MNLTSRPATPFLVPLCVLGGGLSLANCIQITELYSLYWERWMAWAAIVFMAVVCGLTITVAVVLRPVEPEPPAQEPQFTAEQIAAVDDYRDLNPLPGREGQSYEATMQRRKPAPEIQMSEPQLARYVMYLLDGDGVVSARGMAHIGTPADTAKVRRWLWRMRWADERNKTAVLHDRGRDALRELLPHLDRGRE